MIKIYIYLDSLYSLDSLNILYNLDDVDTLKV